MWAMGEPPPLKGRFFEKRHGFPPCGLLWEVPTTHTAEEGTELGGWEIVRVHAAHEGVDAANAARAVRYRARLVGHARARRRALVRPVPGGPIPVVNVQAPVREACEGIELIRSRVGIGDDTCAFTVGRWRPSDACDHCDQQ
jgi:hypothetical protein